MAEKLKVLILNGSPKSNGNTAFALNEMISVFNDNDIETELIQVGNEMVGGCKGCGYCYKNDKCIQDDIVNVIAEKFEKADALIVGSPVYYASANGVLDIILSRLFYSTNYDKTMKVGAAVCVCRRSGITATTDQLNKYFTISGMAVASSCYWNGIHGAKPGEAAEDAEGIRTMRTLAKNVVFLMKSIALGKEKFGLPEKEPKATTNFIRKK